MRLRTIAILTAIALSTAGCSGCSTVSNVTAAINAPARTLVDEKTVLAAELGYGVILDTAKQGAIDGRIKGDDARRAADVIRRVEMVRPAVHTALRMGNQTDLVLKFNDFRALSAELATIAAANGVK